MFLKRLTLKNLLSFRDATVELGPLNVLIGENSAGKSNLIEAVSLLQAAPRSAPNDLASVIRRGGGIRYWLWLADKVASPVATLGCDLGNKDVSYKIDFSEESRGFVILNESLGDGHAEGFFERAGGSFSVRETASGPVDLNKSVLEVFRFPADKTPTTELGRSFDRIQIYGDFQTGPGSGAREGSHVSMPKDYLMPTGENLALVLQNFESLRMRERMTAYVKRFSDRIEEVVVRLEGLVARPWMYERELLEPLPSMRMSDGTLKFLCLLAILLHPDPPPLVCIDEPENGLHPDALQIVADLLREASERMQLIVTTHAQALVDALSDQPESVLVCERDFDGGTQCRRLSRTELEGWLERYTLGALWRKGEIGGNRW